MGYLASITAQAKIDRETAADGEWFTNNILAVCSGNAEYLAEQLDSVEVDKIPTISALGVYGVNAENKIKPYVPLSAIENSAKNGASAWGIVSGYDLAKIQSDAKAGADASAAVKNVDFATIKVNTDYGNTAWTKIQAWASKFGNISADAMAGAKANALMQPITKSINYINDNYDSLAVNLNSGVQASTTLNKNKPTWDNLVTSSKSASNWTSTWQTVYDLSSKEFDSFSNKVYTAESAWDAMAGKAASAIKWNQMLSSVSSTNGSATWTNAYSILSGDYPAQWTSAYNWVKSNSSTLMNNLISALSGNVSAKWNTLFTTVTANSANWFKAYATAYSALGKDKWNAAYASGNDFQRRLFTNVKSANWNSAYSIINGGVANWDTAYKTLTANGAKDNWNDLRSKVSSFDITWVRAGRGDDWDTRPTKLNAATDVIEHAYEAFEVMRTHSGYYYWTDQGQTLCAAPMWEYVANMKSTFWSTAGSVTSMAGWNGSMTNPSFSTLNNWLKLSDFWKASAKQATVFSQQNNESRNNSWLNGWNNGRDYGMVGIQSATPIWSANFKSFIPTATSDLKILHAKGQITEKNTLQSSQYYFII